MFTLLGSLLGFTTSFLPKVMDYFNRKQDNAHELAMLEKMHANKMEMTAIDANIREVETIHEHDAALDGGKFINGLRASVRPVVTYMFMALFVAIEVTALWALIDMGTKWGDALLIIWDDEMMGMWSAILAFWFGGREFRKK
mgnify:CR=1 FL=1|jgi:hypothetical protein